MNSGFALEEENNMDIITLSEKEIRTFLSAFQNALPDGVTYCSCPHKEVVCIGLLSCIKAKEWQEYNLSDDLTMKIPYLDCKIYKSMKT